MNIKKILALASAITMLCGALTGCGDSGDDDNDRSSGKKSESFFDEHSESNSETDSTLDKSSENDGVEDNQKPDEEPDEMEIYDKAMRMLDTWLMGRIEGDQAKAESVLYPDKELRFGDEYSPINGYNDYEVTQFLVTDISKDINDKQSKGMKIQKGFQLNSNLVIFREDGRSDKDTCTDCILKINGEWYFFPDTHFRNIESKRIGFTYSPLRTAGFVGSSYRDPDTGERIEENYYKLPDGTKISEEEYKKTIIKVYGYYVEKNSNGTFSFHQIEKDGSFTLNDGRTENVLGENAQDYSENASE